MANGEPVEIAALTNNLNLIVDTVTMGGNLPWFADRLVEKRFLPRRASQGILGTFGVPPDRQANQLLDSVFTKLRTVDRKKKWFDDFVDIFSREAAYEDLALALRRSVGSPVQPAASACAPSTPTVTPEDFAGFPEPSLIDLIEVVGMDLRARWKEVGLLLNVRQSDLDAIEEDCRGNSQRCMTKVFTTWHDGMSSEYSWKNLAVAVCSPVVGRKGLLPDMLQRLQSKYA